MKMIKRRGTHAIMIVTGLLICEIQNTNAQNLDAEARAEVQKHFERFWIQRDDSWFGIVTEFPEGSDHIQAKGIKFDVRSRGPASEADRLNGVDWSGDVEVYARVARRRHGASWGEWESGTEKGVFLYYYYKVEKRNGKWTAELKGTTRLQRPEAPPPVASIKNSASPNELSGNGRQAIIYAVAKDFAATLRESDKVPPGFGRAEDLLVRLKAIDISKAPEDMKRGVTDYIAALEGAIEAAKAGRETKSYDDAMTQAKQRIIAGAK